MWLMVVYLIFASGDSRNLTAVQHEVASEDACKTLARIIIKDAEKDYPNSILERYKIKETSFHCYQLK
jgi:hypothetical protein